MPGRAVLRFMMDLFVYLVILTMIGFRWLWTALFRCCNGGVLVLSRMVLSSRLVHRMLRALIWMLRRRFRRVRIGKVMRRWGGLRRR